MHASAAESPPPTRSAVAAKAEGEGAGCWCWGLQTRYLAGGLLELRESSPAGFAACPMPRYNAGELFIQSQLRQ
jgi:hypothetical protein